MLAAIERVVVEPAHEAVIAAISIERVVARTAVRRIGARIAPQHVIAAVAGDGICAGAGVQPVRSGLAVQRVVASKEIGGIEIAVDRQKQRTCIGFNVIVDAGQVIPQNPRRSRHELCFAISEIQQLHAADRIRAVAGAGPIIGDRDAAIKIVNDIVVIK